MGTSKKNPKATKKFEKKHLKGVLEQRKAVAKVNQRKLLAGKKKAKRSRDESGKGSKETRSNGAREIEDRRVSEMSVDEFFQGGFESISKSNGAKILGKKRKRSEPEDAAEGSVSGSSGSGGEEFEGFQGAGSDSDDEDEGSDVDMGMTKQAMDGLEEKDPEFYNFLKQNDPEALDFDENADLAEVDELSDGGDEDAAEAQPKKRRKGNDKDPSSKKKKPSDDRILTREMVASWRKAISETKSLRAARQVVLAFRCAATLNRVDEGGPPPPFKIESAEVFHDVLVLALKEVPEVVQSHVPVKETAAGKVYVPTDSKKFKALSILIRSYTSSILHLMSTLSDAKTLNLSLSGLCSVLPYLLTFRKLLRVLVKSVVGYWCQPASAQTTRIAAFLILLRLVVVGDRTLRETVLKATYQGLIQGCRLTSPNTIQGINLMKNSAAELWGIDTGIAYTTAFNFIRQLGIHLRNSIVHNKNEAFRAIYNWQYIHSLDFWSCMLSENCNPARRAEAGAGKGSELKLLIYPLVQVTLGAMRLIPSSTYFPLRFHLIRSLLRISRATGTYIPLASVLLEVLDSAEMKNPPKGSTLKPLDFATAYKAPKSYLRTRIYQDGVSDQLVELFGEYLVLWSTNVAFPEFSLPVVIQLKRWLKLSRRRGKGNKNNRMSSALAVLVQKIEATAKEVEHRRATVDFTPKDRAQVEAFTRDMPWEKTALGAYVVAQRLREAEKAKMTEQARRDEERQRKEDEREQLEEGNVGEFGEDEDEEDDEEGETEGSEEEPADLGDLGDDKDDEDE